MQQTDLNVKAGAEASFEAFTGSASTHTEKQKKESILANYITMVNVITDIFFIELM